MLQKAVEIVVLSLYCGLIYWLSDQSMVPAPLTFSHADKLYHVIAYSIMGVLAWVAFRAPAHSHCTTALISILFCLIFAISDELHQLSVPGRFADFWDWLADTTGVTASVTLLYIASAKKLSRDMRGYSH